MSKQLSLQSFGITRPVKVKWRANIINNDLFASIRSKSLRKFLQKADDVLAENEIHVESRSITKEEYIDWLSYYKEKMTERGFKVIATEEFYDDRKSQGKDIGGIFFTKLNVEKKQLVGSIIYTTQEQDLAVNVFKASDQLNLASDKNSSLGSILDFFFLREMLSKNMKNISGGKSTNAFGAINTLGYPAYKSRFTYVPAPADDIEFVSTVPLNEEGIVTFYGRNEAGEFAAYGAHPAGTQVTFELAQYETPELPFHDVEYMPDQLVDVAE